MKSTLRAGKVVLISSAALMCYATAFATAGNPDETLLRNEHVQNSLQKNHGTKAKEGWNKLDSEQQQNLKQKENQRLHTIGNNKKQEHQDNQGQSSSETAE